MIRKYVSQKVCFSVTDDFSNFSPTTESCLVELLMSVSDLSGPKMPQARLHTLLDVMWTVMDPQEVENTFENILISLLTAYRYVSIYSLLSTTQYYSVLLSTTN